MYTPKLSNQNEPCSWLGVLNTTLCDKVRQLLATGQWFSPGTLVSFTNKTDCHDITEIWLKVALNANIKLYISLCHIIKKTILTYINGS
jgi:hypothetical protein